MINQPNKLYQISCKTGIATNSLVELFLCLIDTEINNVELTTKTGISKTGLATIKKDMPEYFLPVSTTTRLSLLGEKFAKQLSSNIVKNGYSNILNLKVDDNLHDLISVTHSSRPSADRNLDQFFAISNTVLNRTQIMSSLYDLQDKRVLLLGDDDLLSIAISSLSLVKNISVIDSDNRMLNHIKKISQEKGLNINTYKHDLRNKLPGEFSSSFDVIFTDPPYTPYGIELFLSRAIDALDRKNKAGRIYFCYGNSELSKEKFLEIQEIICNLGLMIKYVFEKFNRYTGADSIGNSSNLYICDVTPKTRPSANINTSRKLYTNDL